MPGRPSDVVEMFKSEDRSLPFLAVTGSQGRLRGVRTKKELFADGESEDPAIGEHPRREDGDPLARSDEAQNR